MKFVSFHSHDTYSYADALGSTERHVKTVAELGMTALGTSNHGNVNNHVQMEKWCGEYGIKPIYGCEIYFAPAIRENKYQRKTHLTIFAMDGQGYRNLNRIITQSYIDTYKWPTVSWKTLRKYSKGIAVLSGCADSLISCSLLGGKFLGPQRDEITDKAFKNAERRLQRFAEVFEGRFYIEVQRFPHFGRTCTLNPAYAQLSRITGIPLIATADVHYPTARENTIQALLHNARWSSDESFVAEASWEHSANLSYPLSDQEIYRDLKSTGLTRDEAIAAIYETGKLAKRCSVDLPKARPLIFPGVSKELPAHQLIHDKIAEGWNKRVKQRPDLTDKKEEYDKRIKHELSIILSKDFENYFLSVGDLVSWAKQQNIDVGPGRGSAAGSLVCYVLGITEIDPMHPLFSRMIFERFIDPNRSDMPDIDLDFDDELRQKVVERARKVYGQENVCSVANHTKYRGKRAIQDVARAYRIPYSVFKPITKRISTRVETDDRVDDSLIDILDSYGDSPDISGLVDQYEDQLVQAIELEGNQHSMGIHAGGFVISSDPIPNVCAIYTKEKGSGRTKEMAQVIPYEKRDAEYLNMLKMDFLGLTTMGMMGLCRKWTRTSLSDLYSLIYREYNKWESAQKRTAFKGNTFDTIFNAFCNDDVVGIFQYEGGTTRQVVREVQPSNFDELAACNALSRPGPYYGGQTRQYIAVKNGEQELEKIHPNYDKHVEWTYGQIVYQEQIMWILRDVAGFDTATVLRVRKIIGKKLGEFQFAALWEQFKSGVADTSGINEDIAIKIWSSITTAAGYAFNTAHAYSYGLIAWQQMYFKLYHPANIFYASSLAKNGDGKDDLPRRTELLKDAGRKGIKTLPVLIEASGLQWQPQHAVRDSENPAGYLLPGLMQLPKVGPATAEDLIAWRANLPFQDYDNLNWDGAGRSVKNGGCAGVGPVTVENIKAFVDSPDPFKIDVVEKQLQAFREQLDNGEFEAFGLPASEEFVSSYDLTESPTESSFAAFVGFVANVVERDEVESKRQRTGLSAEKIRAAMDAPDKTKKATIFAYDEFGEVALRTSRFTYGGLAERIGAIKADFHIVVGYGRVFEGKANSIQLKNLWILDPD